MIAAFTEEERERLSAVSAEVINRRAPAWLVENGDIFALLTEVGAIESRKIEAALALAEQIRQPQRSLARTAVSVDVDLQRDEGHYDNGSVRPASVAASAARSIGPLARAAASSCSVWPSPQPT